MAVLSTMAAVNGHHPQEWSAPGICCARVCNVRDRVLRPHGDWGNRI